MAKTSFLGLASPRRLAELVLVLEYDRGRRRIYVAHPGCRAARAFFGSARAPPDGARRRRRRGLRKVRWPTCSSFSSLFCSESNLTRLQAGAPPFCTLRHQIKFIRRAHDLVEKYQRSPAKAVDRLEERPGPAPDASVSHCLPRSVNIHTALGHPRDVRATMFPQPLP